MNELRRGANSSIRRAMVAGQGRIVLRFAAIAALFAAVGLFHAATRIAVVNAGYDLGKVQREQRELLGEQERLKMETATLRAASRLESIAKEQLGLTRPSAGQVITLGPAGSRPARESKRTTVASAERPSTTLTPESQPSAHGPGCSCGGTETGL